MYLLMKKILFSILLFLFLVVWSCFAEDLWYKIKSLHIDCYLHDDWNLYVVEDIWINYNEVSHGFFRDIPYLYELDDDNLLKTDVSGILVDWAKFSKSKKWNFISLKIGSKDEDVFWYKDYRVSYLVDWAVRSFSWWQELYRNLIWTEWDTSIENVALSIYLPDETLVWDNDFYWNIWKFWSKKEFDLIKIWTVIKNNEPINLKANEWITVSIKFPANSFETKEVIVKKSLWRKFMNYIDTNEKVLFVSYCICWLIIIALIIAWWFLYCYLIEKSKNYNKFKWKKFDNVKDVIYYDPPKWYTPWEVAVIKDLESTTTVFPTMLYHWIGQWLVELSPSGKRVFFKKKDDADIDNYKFTDNEDNISYVYRTPEKSFWNFCFDKFDLYDPNAILTVNEADLLKNYADSIYYHIMNKFCPWISKTSFDIFSLSWKNIWTEENSSMLTWFTICLIIAFYMYIDGYWNLSLIPIWLYFVSLIYSLVSNIITVRKIWNHLTEEAKEVISHVWWFRKYLLAVEDKKLNALIEQDPHYFEKILPYAIALWVWDEWIKKYFKLRQVVDKNTTQSFNYSYFDDNYSKNINRSFHQSMMIWKIVQKVESTTHSYNSDSWWWSSSSWWDSSSRWSSGSSWWGSSWWHSWFSWWWGGGWWGHRW